MFRILVVDNEPYVVDWISMLLESQTEETDVCRAYTASEALGWLVRSRIDIVISDICMPEMDGLKLAERVKKCWPFAKVILITAYAQFDYAVSAIKNNVASYILKTEGDDVIIGEVKRVMGLVTQELKQAAALGQQRDDLKMMLPELRGCFLRDLLERGEEDEERLKRQLEALELPMDVNTRVRVILCAVKEWETVDNLVLRRKSVMRMMEWMEGYLGDCGNLYPIDMGGIRMVWLVQGEQDVTEETGMTFIQGRLELLQDVYLADTGEHCSFALCQQAAGLRSIRNAYRSLERLMNRIFQEKESFVVLDGKEAGVRSMDTEVVLRRMERMLEEEKYDRFLSGLEYYQRAINERQIEIEACYNMYYSLALLLNAFLEDRQIAKSAQINQLKTNLFAPPAPGQWERKFQALSDLARLAFSMETEMKARISGNIVKAVKKYVSEHIAEDISLTRLSEVTGYNTCYLSRTFKGQTGETLTEYVGRKKMELIRKLFLNVDLNINEVAERSGFVSRTYFNRFIKKHTGMSPRDYKQSLESS